MFTELEYQLKGQKRKINLRPLTLITGPQASGKTTLLDAYRLAATGVYPRGNRQADLAELGPDSYAIGRGPKGSGSWNPRTHSRPDFRISDSDSLSRALKEAAKTRADLFDRFGSAISAPLILGPDEQTEYKKLGGEINAELATKCVSEVRSIGLRCGQIEREISAASSDFGLGGAERLPDLERERAQIQEYESAVRHNNDIAAIIQQATEARIKIARYEKAVEPLRAQVLKLQVDLADQNSKLKFGETVLEVLRPARDTNVCPCCRSGVDASKLWNEILGKVEERRRSVTDAQILLREQDMSLQALERGAQESRQLAGLALEAKPVPTKPTRTVSEVDAEMASIQHAELKRRNLAGLRAELETLRRRQTAIKGLGNQISQTMTSQIARIKEIAEAEVNKFMSSGYQARLILTEKDCRWGVESNDGIRSPRVACESQRTALSLALALAWGDRVLLLDDQELAGYSAKGIRTLSDQLVEHVSRGALDQVLMTRHSDRFHECSDDFFRVDFGEVAW
jgi:energy-coupling factor transporter ATP-binding protein EcfA2